jgi:hypothetical protein
MVLSGSAELACGTYAESTPKASNDFGQTQLLALLDGSILKQRGFGSSA